MAGGRREIRCPVDGTLAVAVPEVTGSDPEDAAVARRPFGTGDRPRIPGRQRGAPVPRTVRRPVPGVRGLGAGGRRRVVLDDACGAHIQPRPQHWFRG